MGLIDLWERIRKDKSISNSKQSMKAEVSYVMYKEVFIPCSARAEKAENQGQGLVVRTTELHIRINSQ